MRLWPESRSFPLLRRRGDPEKASPAGAQPTSRPGAAPNGPERPQPPKVWSQPAVRWVGGVGVVAVLAAGGAILARSDSAASLTGLAIVSGGVAATLLLGFALVALVMIPMEKPAG